MKTILSRILALVLCLMLSLSVVGFAFAEEAAATTEGEATSPIAMLIGTFLPMILIVVVFWLFLIRPQRKKDKKVKEMLNNLKSGDRVTTIGGIYGTIVSIKDDTITLAVGQKNSQPTEMIIARWAIRNVEEISVENEGEMLN